jgi:hypothetical protein
MHRFSLLICCCAVLAGCGGKRPQTIPWSHRGNAGTNSAIVTPGGSLPGKVVSFNPNGRFAVLRFPLGEMPPQQRRVGVFRDGLKVGEMKISGPQRDTHTVADLIAGECRAGDEVRPE